MEDDLKKTTAETPAAEERAEGQNAPEAETLADETQRKIDELMAQYQQMRELAARAQADGINYRNWAEREMKRLKAYGSERAVLAMLPVFDNLERALDSAEADPASIKEGVRMVRQQFADALKDLGVTELDPAGKPFSPAEHDAMGMVPVSDRSQDGLVHTVVRKGFQMAEKVIRPALVMVGRYAENTPEGNGEQQ
ncbi:MAG: nucleotide exchange factor GrpE [Pyramidobacter sp.]|uniref:nucleotide exchange factor GrpE n=1 Tax=Pyramidobacter sp. TaxID=1943581 RepID=UPI002A7F4CCC|nr:nucleotide exchange factor GrpE [Pyramidobacter sp.]MDY4032717.1 nucleotide exchange factor GrpE [Pyramidobacter sp.]